MEANGRRAGYATTQTHPVATDRTPTPPINPDRLPFPNPARRPGTPGQPPRPRAITEEEFQHMKRELLDRMYGATLPRLAR